MWTCPKCQAQYVQKNLWHSCNRITEREFLRGKSKRGIELYKHFLNEYRKIGKIKLHVLRSRIAFMVKVRFSGVSRIGQDFIVGGFWLKQKQESKKFFKIEQITPNDYIHRFRIKHESDIDSEFRKYMKAAYAIGQRKHIKPNRP